MIDTHAHHWDLRRFQYPWLDDPAFDELRNDYCPADYRADAAGVDVEGWIHIQAEVDHQLDPMGETAWVATLAEEATAAGLPGPWRVLSTPTCGLPTSVRRCTICPTSSVLRFSAAPHDTSTEYRSDSAEWL